MICDLLCGSLSEDKVAEEEEEEEEEETVNPLADRRYGVLPGVCPLLKCPLSTTCCPPIGRHGDSVPWHLAACGKKKESAGSIVRQRRRAAAGVSAVRARSSKKKKRKGANYVIVEPAPV
jgi:hypothetical protein